LKPHKTIGSLHDPEISNTRFDNNSTGLSFVFKLSCNSIIKLGFCHRSVDQQNRLRYQLLKIKSTAIRAVLRKSVTL
jgi:hypothetical protein